MDYYKKYLKYKLKYIELKGGTVLEISQDLELYKGFMIIYSDLIKLNILLSSTEIIFTKEDDIESRVATTNRVRYIGQSDKLKKLKTEMYTESYDTLLKKIEEEEILKESDGIIYKIKKTHEYTYLSRFSCFFQNCALIMQNGEPSDKICLYNYSDYILIGFNIGKANCLILPFIDKNKFLIFLKNLCSNFSDNISKILLFGHSYGMTSATATAYILLCLLGVIDVFDNLQEFNTQITEFKADEEIISLIEKIRGKEIIVIGSGGTPNLFSNMSEFIIFYNALQNKYIHFASIDIEKLSDDGNYNYDHIDRFISALECKSSSSSSIYKNFLICLIYDIKENASYSFINIADKDIPRDLSHPRTRFTHDISTYEETLKRLLK